VSLDALRMTTARHPEHTFLAAGAPCLHAFGRDSLWAARFMLPLGTRLAGDTLRILAKFQGVTDTPATAEEPGKIMHELRRQSLVLDDISTLPPLYYGTIDATPLWVCLLHDAWRWGLPDTEVECAHPSPRGRPRVDARLTVTLTAMGCSSTSTSQATGSQPGLERLGRQRAVA